MYKIRPLLNNVKVLTEHNGKNVSTFSSDYVPVKCISTLTMRGSGSRGGFSPEGFGPALWFSLHTAAAGEVNHYTRSTQDSWKQLLKHFWVMIPCAACRTHYRQIIDNIDLDSVTTDRETLFNFTVDLHNVINYRLGKAFFPTDLAREIYMRPTGPITVISHTVKILD